jgi:hypothetical protein
VIAVGVHAASKQETDMADSTTAHRTTTNRDVRFFNSSLQFGYGHLCQIRKFRIGVLVI